MSPDAGIFGDLGIPSTLRQLTGVFEAAASQSMTTSELWGALREAADVQGLSTEGWDIFSVNTMRSSAVGIRRASESLEDIEALADRSGLNQSLSYAQIATPWYGRDLAEQNAAPNYIIRQELMIENPEYLAGVPGAPETYPQWSQITVGELPQTTDDLANLRESAEWQRDGTPPGQVLGFGRTQIMSV